MDPLNTVSCSPDKGDFIYTSRMKDSILHFLQTVFATPELFGDQPNIFQYSDDERISRIMIADSNTENIQSINDKPAILVNRGPITAQTMSMGDRTTETFLGGIEHRELLLHSNIEVQCYSREGLEAETLAVVVFKIIRYLNQDIQKNYSIFDIEARAVGSEQPIIRESTSNLVMVPVSVAIAVPDAVCIRFDKIQLNEIDISTSDGLTIAQITTEK